MSKNEVASLSDEKLIDAYLTSNYRDYFLKLPKTDAGKEMLSAEPARRAKIVALAIEKLRKARFDPMGTDEARLRQIISDVIRAKSPAKQGMTPDDLAAVVAAAARIGRSHRQFEYFPKKSLIGAVEKVAAKGSISGALREALESWRKASSPRALTDKEETELARASAVALDEDAPWEEVSPAWGKVDDFKRVTTPLKAERELLDRLNKILGSSADASGEDQADVIPANDAVGAAVQADRKKNGVAFGADWLALLRHALTLRSTTPSKKWLVDGAALVAGVSARGFADRVREWFSHAGKPAPTDRPGAFGHPVDRTLLNDKSADLLKGLSWAIVAAKRADLAPELASLAYVCFQKVKDHGPRNVRAANSAVAALAALASPEAGAQLAQLRPRVKHPSARKAIDQALASLSKSTGLTIDDLSEMGVPTFGLDIRSPVDVKTLPKETSKALGAQSLRIEQLFITARTWTANVWRERYLDHPLVALLARRLIWVIDQTPAAWLKGKLLDARDKPVVLKAKSEIRLWHPTMSKAADVLAWRQWLERHEVVQPFKQAHREVYLLTDAERKTRTYSNRFAAHVLRQHQLAALCQSRGWNYALQGNFDSSNVPTLPLPAHELVCEFDVHPIEEHRSPQEIYLYVESDQVRFGRPLAAVPKIVFSEVMRGVDLFVGVTSVGNDPTWQDGGPEGRFRDYWQSYSFGDLTETAKTRKAVLERIIPRLSIASRASLNDKFLLVKGDMRTYKIHLGSGNVLMDPNDEYLCIVPDRSSKRVAKTDGTLFLPFEGDQTLSVILSKAFLLANDRKITDPTIARQIKKA